MYQFTPAEIKARRLALGLTQVDLAKALNCCTATVTRWECGRGPKSDRWFTNALAALDLTSLDPEPHSRAHALDVALPKPKP